MHTPLQRIKSKIFTHYNDPELLRQLSFYRFKNKKIVFTNGCFDILHKGHVEYLAKAASLGDVLIVGLNSDESVKRLKGEHRPVNNQDARSLLLASLAFVSDVVIFTEDTPLELQKVILPQVMVKGGDYKAEEIVGYDLVTSKGGQVVIIDMVEGYSTTSIIKKTEI